MALLREAVSFSLSGSRAKRKFSLLNALDHSQAQARGPYPIGRLLEREVD
ncbi:MAG: hypothetical protein K6U11_05870 [bacterium]|nr:hypothetical protein [bacterium]